MGSLSVNIAFSILLVLPLLYRSILLRQEEANNARLGNLDVAQASPGLYSSRMPFIESCYLSAAGSHQNEGCDESQLLSLLAETRGFADGW
ncbi:hypothetical protein U1Q18_013281 [Sarracenia purpurea var. burkii]